jgi:hypothetical protein
MRTLRSPHLAPTAFLLAGVLLSACGQKPAEVRVTPAKVQLFGKDRSSSVKGDVVDKKGNPLADQKLAWES